VERPPLLWVVTAAFFGLGGIFLGAALTTDGTGCFWARPTMIATYVCFGLSLAGGAVLWGGPMVARRLAAWRERRRPSKSDRIELRRGDDVLVFPPRLLTDAETGTAKPPPPSKPQPPPRPEPVPPDTGEPLPDDVLLENVLNLLGQGRRMLASLVKASRRPEELLSFTARMQLYPKLATWCREVARVADQSEFPTRYRTKVRSYPGRPGWQYPSAEEMADVLDANIHALETMAEFVGHEFGEE
jgi:hypothetical protein